MVSLPLPVRIIPQRWWSCVNNDNSNSNSDGLSSWCWRYHRLLLLCVFSSPLLIRFVVSRCASLPLPSSADVLRADEMALLQRVIVESAVPRGAVCLDGSAPGYYVRNGTGSGAHKWIVFFEGGGWCLSQEQCFERSGGFMGSSRFMSETIWLPSGLFSVDKDLNPDFYNWNVAYFHYCDGASFAGDVSGPVLVKGGQIFFRGHRIVDALIDDMLEAGLINSTHVLIAGCSAGGVATLLNCDFIRNKLPTAAVVKCLSDAGMFLDLPDITGRLYIQERFSKLFEMQNLRHFANKECTNSRSPDFHYQCFFGEYLLPLIKTPFFVVNSNYDTWNLGNVVVPSYADPDGEWNQCIVDAGLCDAKQMEYLQGLGTNGSVKGFSTQMLDVVSSGIRNSNSTHGAFLFSCSGHCATAAGWRKLAVDGQFVGEAVGSWYFEREKKRKTWFDCLYPCNACTGFSFSVAVFGSNWRV